MLPMNVTRGLNLLTILIVASVVGSVAFAWPSSSSDLFRVYDLEFEGEFASYHVEDLNNDGLKDLMLLLQLRENERIEERKLSIYLQDKEGFAEPPNQTFTLAEDIILFDIGDVAGDLKKEFVYFSREGIFHYTLSDTAFILNAHKLFETESLFMLSDRTSLVTWDFVADLNDDEVDEVFVPKITQCDIHFRNPKSNDWLINEIPLRAEPNVRGFYDEDYSVGNRADALYSTPHLLTEDFNDDGKIDLMGVYEDSLVVFCQDEEGFFSQRCHHSIELHFGKIWRGQKIQRTRWGDKSERFFLRRIGDLNDDGVVDALSVRISTRESVMNPKNELHLYLGKRDTTDSVEEMFFADQPDQIVKPGGTLLVLDILDLNDDRKHDLVMPTVNVGLTNIIRMLLTKSVEIQAETYLMKEDRYPDEPDSKTKMVIKFSFRGGTTSPVYEIEDFNGDGYLDVLSSQEEKRLVLFWGKEDDLFESNVGSKFNILLPQNGELVSAMNMNRDEKCDIVIVYDEDNPKYPKLQNKVRILLAN
ncbi:hypothetical protein GWO43_23895 [candidate division KSB1 bacterium]|nr:hypothetical protein [candidate division KSB1 bacterium]NIS27019.1 hypothetical protein [candidate division KSB1 bacterium]NIT73859.1 hypothetical protein [candidate division KSB1 bacterium]NIU27764.1 hypothetical protein [candidate division KSB1 bacterium]NIU94571.1 hypothetical protein [candidate division KSB1 bacterium]